jgi:hypothetical protein
VLKVRLHKNLPVSRAIQIIIDQTRLLGREYDADINQQRRTTPRLLDLRAFSAVKSQLTHYALELTSREWSATKQMADDIEEGKEEEFKFDLDMGCSFGCELPARFGLPCRHWMYSSVVKDCPLPLSLFHPRWLFDGPAVLYDCWVARDFGPLHQNRPVTVSNWAINTVMKTVRIWGVLNTIPHTALEIADILLITFQGTALGFVVVCPLLGHLCLTKLAFAPATP